MTTLVGSEWSVEDSVGRRVADSSHAVLQFLPNGQIDGSGSCNRLLVRYMRDVEALCVHFFGATTMACTPALMNQERVLLDLLPRIANYQIDETDLQILKYL